MNSIDVTNANTAGFIIVAVLFISMQKLLIAQWRCGVCGKDYWDGFIVHLFRVIFQLCNHEGIS